MSKQSGWVIIATEGATVDGRTITASWIKDMAESYSVEEYTALIWPEHYRSQWSSFEGKNWGTVDEVKAEKKGGKLRLFAKITANHYLIEANKDGQKLFTSIEPNLDYRGTGKCYLMGLAVTDSPASSGTTRLKFSMGGKDCEREYSQLEPLLFLQADTEQEEHEAAGFFKALAAGIAKYLPQFSAELPTDTTPQPEEIDVKKEELEALLQGALQPFSTRLDAIEQKFNAPAPTGDSEETPEGDKGGDVTAPTVEQFSAALSDVIKPLADKLNGLETQFNKLLEEAPNQRPAGEGADDNFSADLV
ncbi:GPO family capsid scaffolding protein [Enterovibrio nigricans]|uniref:Phage capsid scaffolding protein (GPO) serine peptidase n=1 Tax=Enterovibrio nigricans DSM 22720 TaxID=1121868 RepID=A0A1T4UEU8_9GAMM|nr:GPO family capsid scaffolding protein [Enterovibrio nigricans]PKF51115.1 capsid protein [Enterovibrio nigricans]SKA51219.1 Phage capsid scaffolding protein (GPO) serine peptidase [Enterovibrio nigricans DSM 22720]